MKKAVVLIVLLSLSVVSLFAQGYKVRGRVLDEKNHKPLSHVSVALIGSDSTTVLSKVVDRNGAFEFKSIAAGDYTISASYLGFQTLTVSIKNLHSDYNIGDLYLAETAVELEDVYVSAELNRYELDRQIVVVTESLRERSSDAFDLLYHSALPELQYNIAEKSVSTLKTGALQLRIDGVIHPMKDLATILPSSVASIEYIDQPGIRYGDGVATVINIKTRREEAGVQVGVNTNNAVNRQYGNNSVFLRRITTKDILGLTGGAFHQKGKSAYTNAYKELHFPTAIAELEQRGVPQDNKYRNYFTKLEYNRNIGDNLVLNAFADYSFIRSPDNLIEFATLENKANQHSEKTLIDDKSHNLTLDLYLEWKIKKGESLLFNATGTYISSDYERSYIYDELPLSEYGVDGKRKSLIAELIYERGIKEGKHRFSAGARGFFANTDNSYRGSTGNIDPFMRSRDIYAFAEIKGAFSKLSYSLGAGLSAETFREYDIKKTYTFFRPSLNLTYSFTPKLRLGYRLWINPLKPTLSDMTQIRQPINNYEIMIGNPYLKPYQSYANNLSLSYYSNRTVLSLTGYLQYSKDVIFPNPVEFSESEGNVFVHTMENQKSFIHGQIRAYASHKMLNDRLTITANGAMNRYINRGNDLTTTYTAYLFGSSIAYNEKSWGVTASYRSPLKMGMAHVISKGSHQLQLYGYYKYSNFTFGVGALNPFLKNKMTSSRKQNYEHYKTISKNYNKLQFSRVYLTLSWNFQSGKSRSYRKQIENVDRDTGIVK